MVSALSRVSIDFYASGSFLQRLILICYALIISILFSCNKRDKIEPDIVKVNYISKAFVKDADVQLDTLNGIIQVQLPTNYLRDSIHITLSLPPGVGTNPSALHVDSSKITLNYHFEGREPKAIPLYQLEGEKVRFKYFKIFVRHSGSLVATVPEKYIYFNPLPQDIGPIDDGFIKIRLDSGLGSIPDSPADTSRLVPFLREVVKNITIGGFYDELHGVATFEGISSFRGSKNVKIGFLYGQKSVVYPEPIQVLRAPPTAKIDLDYKGFKFLKYREIVNVNGGFFLPDSKYSLIFSQSDLVTPIPVDARRINHHSLQIEVPANIREGVYKVSSFEDDKAISHSIYHVSNNAAARSIHYIWQEDWTCPSQNFVDLPPQQVKVGRGGYVNINPFPLIVQNKNSPFDPQIFKFKLVLRNQRGEFIIEPDVRVDECYGDQSFNMYYGRFVIPQGVVPGLYEAMLVDPAGAPSLVSWQKILIM